MLLLSVFRVQRSFSSKSRQQKSSKTETMASSPDPGTSGMSLNMSELGAMLEKSCIEVAKLREDHNEITSKTLERRKENIDFEHHVVEKKVQHTTTILTNNSEKQKPYSEIPKIEEEIKEIEAKRREVRIEVLMLRVQRNSYRTYLVELKKKVKEEAKTKRKMAVRDKKNQTRNQVFVDALEVVSHNCTKLLSDQQLAANVLSLTVGQLQLIRQSRGKVERFTRECEAEIEGMRRLILKK